MTTTRSRSRTPARHLGGGGAGPVAEERYGGVIFPYQPHAPVLRHESRLWSFFKVGSMRRRHGSLLLCVFSPRALSFLLSRPCPAISITCALIISATGSVPALRLPQFRERRLPGVPDVGYCAGVLQLHHKHPQQPCPPHWLRRWPAGRNRWRCPVCTLAKTTILLLAMLHFCSASRTSACSCSTRRTAQHTLSMASSA